MKREPISPYGVSKLAAEEYCRAFAPLYGLETVSLRYFNVFGPRQSHLSEYAAVIPRFIEAMLNGRQPVVYGDGGQSRDFTFVGDIVQANLIAASVPGIGGEVLNIACSRRYSLLDLLAGLKAITGSPVEPIFESARPGDIRHSMADIGRARERLGFEPAWSFRKGLEVTVDWYKKNLGSRVQGEDKEVSKLRSFDKPKFNRAFPAFPSFLTSSLPSVLSQKFFYEVAHSFLRTLASARAGYRTRSLRGEPREPRQSTTKNFFHFREFSMVDRRVGCASSR